MIESMIVKTKQFLPLKILYSEWNGTSLELNGSTWTFNTLSAWRLSTSNRMVCGCYDDNSKEQISLLKTKEIVEIEFQDSKLKIDPVFILSNGQKLEIFSTDTFEPWTFGLNNEIIFVPTPSEPKAFM
jgi:hypothetical protein